MRVEKKDSYRPWRPRLRLVAVVLWAGGWGGSGGAYALNLDTGNPDLQVRFDNTVKLSTVYRTESADAKLVDPYRLLVPGVPASAFPQALNFNAGDDNFRKRGFASARVDLLSELDVVYQRQFGLRISGAAWYDDYYHRASDALGPVNGQNPLDEFPDRTQRLSGGDGEVLDAFVFGGWDIAGKRLNVRLGQHALQYGESLFFGDNGIARAQGPIDINKLLSSPNAQFKEIIRPVPQLSAQLQLSPNVALGGYVQFGWEEDRLPPAGSYFSTANIPWGSSQPESVGIPAGPIAGNYVLHSGKNKEASDSGQFGLQLKWRVGETDLGFYFARYHDKGGQLYGDLNVSNPADSRWYYVFPEAIKTAGVSVSHTFGEVNFALEASVRKDMPLRSTNMLYPSAFSAAPRYATGRTAHVNLSWLASFGPNFIANESSLVGELAWNRVLKTDDPDHQLDHGVTRSATAVQFIYTPTYRQALTGLDLNIPVGVRYTLDGHSAITPWNARDSGAATIGIEGNYLSVWQFSVIYTHYLGKAVPFVDYSGLLTPGGHAEYGDGNPLADRNHIAISLRRTF
ncbi:DUF1302 protein [Thauera aromatica K172]|uniref:DUF1302 protein n=2 Tax=Thauera aromatica TaxID=59405 RepID=A0A2R4BIN3_THAAR|nr:DUF1302 protein [Thauera aromatica K172]